MNSKQETKLNMYSSVISFCNQNTAIIESVPALKSAFDAFKDAVSGIDNFSRNFELARPGITQDKKQLRENLARIASGIASNIFAYAEEIGRNELKSLTNFKIANLLRLKDKEMQGICRDIASTATENLSSLVPYNITQASLTELNDALTAYETAAPRPRTAKAAASTNRKKLTAFFIKSDSILKNRMDRMIAPLESANKDFFDSYFSNRIIIDAPTTRTQLKGTVQSKDKKMPLKDILITVTGSELSANTNEDGKYVLRPLSPGSYTIQASGRGYEPLTVTGIYVKLGKISKMNMKLNTSNEIAK